MCEESYRLAGIVPSAYQHPSDIAATAALRAMPRLEVVVRKIIELGFETRMRSDLLASAVRLGPRQLPELWQLHERAFAVLDFADPPELYLTQNPFANAYAFGTDRSDAPVVTIHSGIVDLLDDVSLGAVLAHEAAHIHCGHAAYLGALSVILSIGSALGSRGVLSSVVLQAVQLPLLEWMRKAELSCDRAAALVTRDPDAVCRMLMAIAAGGASRRLDLESFIDQGLEYDHRGTSVDRVRRRFSILHLDHPHPIHRVRELMDWIQSGAYDRILAGDYRTKDDDERVDDAAEAARQYARRYADLVEEAGSSLESLEVDLDEWLDDAAGSPGH
jgi:Zn-dependent protease with chaperone function